MHVIRVVCIFRSQGLQWPLRDNDGVRIETAEGELGILSGEAIRHLIQHHLASVALQTMMTEELKRQMLEEPIRLPALQRLPPVAVREDRRRWRRARKRETSA